VIVCALYLSTYLSQHDAAPSPAPLSSGVSLSRVPASGCRSTRPRCRRLGHPRSAGPAAALLPRLRAAVWLGSRTEPPRRHWSARLVQAASCGCGPSGGKRGTALRYASCGGRTLNQSWGAARRWGQSPWRRPPASLLKAPFGNPAKPSNRVARLPCGLLMVAVISQLVQAHVAHGQHSESWWLPAQSSVRCWS